MSRPHHLIEFRFFGNAKKEIKKLIREINKDCRIRSKYRPVPHITLVGPFTTKNQRKLVSDFKRVCEKQKIMHFNVVGFNTFEDNRVVFIDIKPDKDMGEFRWELSKTLQAYCRLRPWDLKRNFGYHATLASKLNPEKFKKVKNYIKRKPKPNFNHVLMRVTLIKGQKILYEYDFLLRRLLNRREAKSRKILNESFEKLKEYLGVETIETEEDEDWIYAAKPNILKGIIIFFSGLLKKPQIFLISDLHLDHKNIIKYCNRPFDSIEDMNSRILKNWNNKVKYHDVVYFLGDLAFDRGSHPTLHWIGKLKGKIVFIKGSHDRSRKIKFHRKQILEYNGYKFFLFHDPEEAPSNWNGWIIHGHKHNNDLDEFPFINGEKKTINVSCDLLDYTPITIDELLSLDIDNIKRMETINSAPILWK